MPKAKEIVKNGTGLKEKFLSVISSLGSVMGVFSSWTVCHNVCTAAIALLAVIGITVTGMPLLFLQSVALPFWLAGLGLFFVLLSLKILRMGCLSSKALIFNGGLLLFATPIASLQKFSVIFRVVGGVIVLFAVIAYIDGRIRKK